MTSQPLLLYPLALIVLAVVVVRLALLLPCAGGAAIRHRVRWTLWMLGQVSIALGAVSVLVNWPALALPFTFAGLAMQSAIRLNRRSSDR